jgi:hypothetical protein
MYGNLLSLVNQVLTPDVVAKMGDASGISDRSTAQKTIGAAVPALLSALASLASKPEGARRLADTIADQPTNMLADLANSTSGLGAWADIGKSALSSLFGGSVLDVLTAALGRYAGVGGGTARSLMGLLAPVVLGVLAREAGTGASGLTRLLASQKDSFAAAMPQGLSDLLESGGSFDATGTVASSTRRVNETYRAARDRAGTMVHAVSRQASERSPAGWMYWAIPVIALAGLLWYLFSDQRTTEPVAQIAPQARVAPGSAVDGDLQPQIMGAIETLSRTIQSTRNWGSAGDVLPRLQQSTSELDRLTALVNRLPIDARERLAESAKTATARLKTALENASAAPQIAPDTKSALAELRSRLNALAMTPGSLAQQRIRLAADTYLARSPSGGVWMSTYFDRSVFNTAGERIGVIRDLVVGSEGRIDAAVVGVSGFLGIGEKEVGVPFAAVRVHRRDNDWHLVVDTTRDALRDAPAYEVTGERVRLGPAKP